MNLPDSLLEAAKAQAAIEGVTVTLLMIEGLRARITRSAATQQRSITLPSLNLGGATIDISDGRAVRDVLDADQDATFYAHR